MTSTDGNGRDRPTSVPQQPLLTGTAWIVRLICLTALGVTGYLAVTALRSSSVAGCGDGALWDCGHVLTSRWSKWLGLPVSIPAFLMYAAMCLAALFVGPKTAAATRKKAWGLITVMAVAAGASAVWFTALQVFVLGSLCYYCMGAHLCSLVLCAIVLWRQPLGIKWTSGLASFGLVGAAVLIGGQLVTKPAETFVTEVYDEVNVPEEDIEVFALDGVGEDGTSDSLLLSPAEGMPIDAPFYLDPPTEHDHASHASGPDLTQDIEFAADSNPTHDDAAVATSVDGHMNADEEGSEAVPTVSLSPQPPIPSPSPIPQADANAATDGVDQGAVGGASAAATIPRQPRQPKEHMVSILGGRAKLNACHWPIIGSPSAQYIVVELFDYTCPHCRTLNQHLVAARQRYGEKLAVIALPVPLDRKCNNAITSTASRHIHSCELSRLAVAVWRVQPESFPVFHEWLFAPSHGRRPDEARRYATQLVGDEPLRREMGKSIVNQFIAKHVELYVRANKGTIPKLMLPRMTMVGSISSASTLFSNLERELGIRRDSQ